KTPPTEDPWSASLSHQLPELIDMLMASGAVEDQRVAALEWAFLPVLGHLGRKPKLLHRELARSPEFFVEVVSLVYRADGEEPQQEISEDQATRARFGSDLLDSWRTVPGLSTTGAVDADHLRTWVQRSRTLLSACGRQAIGEEIIG